MTVEADAAAGAAVTEGAGNMDGATAGIRGGGGMCRAVLVGLLLLVASAHCYPSEVGTIEEARSYLTEPGRAGQWVVITAKKRGRYVQCANMEDFLRCPFPVWIHAVPTARFTATNSSRGTPYPEVPGATKKVYITAADVTALKNAVGEQGLEPVDVYNQVVDEHERIVGTSYDVVVVLEPPYEQFVPLVRHIFEAAWGVGSDAELEFETDR